MSLEGRDCGVLDVDDSGRTDFLERSASFITSRSIALFLYIRKFSPLEYKKCFSDFTYQALR